MTQISPKVCGVCGQVLDRRGPDEWLHSRELAGLSDHIAVPVNYEDIPVRTMCDFCYDEVPIAQAWTLPAKDFLVPIVGHVSAGSWACCSVCAAIVKRGAWEEIIARVATRKPLNLPTRTFMRRLFRRLESNITGPVRPWRAGDEKVEKR